MARYRKKAKGHSLKFLIIVVCALLVISFINSCGIESPSYSHEGNPDQQTQSSPTITNSEESRDAESQSLSMVEKLLQKADGVLAYRHSGTSGKNDGYLIIDFNSRELRRFTDGGFIVSTEVIEGDLEHGFTAGDHSFKLVKSDRLDQLLQTFIGKGKVHGSRNKTYDRVTLGTAEAIEDRILNWSDYYDKRYREYTVFFGNYEQDNNTENGPEKIGWIVLQQDEEKSLIVSSYLLRISKYNDVDGSMECTWESSTIRTWLNEEFFYDAFSDDERAAVFSVVHEDETTCRDRVFLLSSEEVNTLFVGKKADKSATGTVKANYQTPDAFDGRMNYWWLRSSEDGFKKHYIDREGSRKEDYANSAKGIRPAMWVKTSAIRPLTSEDSSG